VSKVERTHTMPADVGQLPRYQRIDGPAMTPIVDTWMDGNLDDAGEALLAAFFDAYWGDPEPVQSIRIIRVELKE
jgi:hypothetical protein